jgi:intracellular sulfur oxidation DsrE/DsrF family protein
MHAYLQGYARAYGVPEREVNAVLAAQGGTTMYLLGDAVWAKYALGAMAKVNDPRTQQPSVRNTWRSGGDGEMLSAEMAIEGLQRRGAVFLVCENSLHAFATQLSSKTDIPVETVQADLRAGLLPGVIVVPAMVIAVGRAQEHGFTYIST